MPATLIRSRIRIAADADSYCAATDILRSATPQFWSGSDIQFEIGLFFMGTLLADISNIANVFVEVRAMATGGNPPSSAAPCLMQGSMAYADMTHSPTWTDKVSQHATITFTSTQTTLPAGNYWLSIYAVTNDSTPRTITFAAGLILISEDGCGTAASPPDALNIYLTRAQNDARYVRFLAVAAETDLSALNGADYSTGPYIIATAGFLALWSLKTVSAASSAGNRRTADWSTSGLGWVLGGV